MFFSRETAALVPKQVEDAVQRTLYNRLKGSVMGGTATNSVFGTVVVAYLVVAAMHSLIFSFRYSVYSLGAAGIVALGEIPFLLAWGPLARCVNVDVLSAYLTPIGKVYIYGALALGGLGCFVLISLNPLLLFGQVLIAALAHRYYLSSKVGLPI
jgi:hypothetical protein